MTSTDFKGSSPSQSMHWNLRPPVFRSRKRMGLRQFGHIGGGVFLGMTLTLDQARVLSTHITECCRRRGGDPPP